MFEASQKYEAERTNLEENEEVRLGFGNGSEDEILLLASQQYESECASTQKEGDCACTIDNFEDKLLLEASQQCEAKCLVLKGKCSV